MINNGLSIEELIEKMKIEGFKNFNDGMIINRNILVNHIRDMNKRHGEQKWTFRIDNRTYINQEGIEWLIKVSFNYEIKKIDAEINFFKEKIIEYENQLGMIHNDFEYKDMTRKEMEIYFKKSRKTIVVATQRLIKEYGENYREYKIINNSKTSIFSKDAIRIIEQKYFKKEFLYRLEQYHLELKNQVKEIDYV